MAVKLLNTVFNPYFDIFSCILLIVFYAIRRHNNFIDFRNTLSNYLSIFERKENQIDATASKRKRYMIGQMSYFFVIPAILAICVTRISCITNSMINIIAVILTIITSMLFTTLGLLLDMSKKDDIKNYNIVLKETYYAVSFEILICIFILIFCLVYMFVDNNKLCIEKLIASGIIYYLCFMIVFNLFIVLKRMNVILRNRF